MSDTVDATAVARRYAAAYAAFDTDELVAVLAPDLRFRQVNPGGHLRLDTAQAYIDATQEFLDNFETWEPTEATADPLGDRFATTSRMRLRSGRRTYLMQHSEIVTVQGDRVVAIDSACSGARPQPEG